MLMKLTPGVNLIKLLGAFLGILLRLKYLANGISQELGCGVELEKNSPS
jgi:hypothetical protein